MEFPEALTLKIFGFKIFFFKCVWMGFGLRAPHAYSAYGGQKECRILWNWSCRRLLAAL